MRELIFYRCNICGNLICMIDASGVTPSCCGEEMEQVIPNTTDATAEKHVPAIRQDGKHVYVSVGSMPHPMAEEHFIEWITLQTNRGTYTRRLQPGCDPEACFRIQTDEYPIRAYAWCNLHGLWVRHMDG